MRFYIFELLRLKSQYIIDSELDDIVKARSMAVCQYIVLVSFDSTTKIDHGCKSHHQVNNHKDHNPASATMPPAVVSGQKARATLGGSKPFQLTL